MTRTIGTSYWNAISREGSILPGVVGLNKSCTTTWLVSSLTTVRAFIFKVPKGCTRGTIYHLFCIFLQLLWLATMHWHLSPLAAVVTNPISSNTVADFASSSPNLSKGIFHIHNACTTIVENCNMFVKCHTKELDLRCS